MKNTPLALPPDMSPGHVRHVTGSLVLVLPPLGGPTHFVVIQTPATGTQVPWGEQLCREVEVGGQEGGARCLRAKGDQEPKTGG